MDKNKLAEENQKLEIEIVRLGGEIKILKEKNNYLTDDIAEVTQDMEKMEKQVIEKFGNKLIEPNTTN